MAKVCEYEAKDKFIRTRPDNQGSKKMYIECPV